MRNAVAGEKVDTEGAKETLKLKTHVGTIVTRPDEVFCFIEHFLSDACTSHVESRNSIARRHVVGWHTHEHKFAAGICLVRVHGFIAERDNELHDRNKSGDEFTSMVDLF